MRRKISRRTLLQGGAGCMIALPLLEGMRVASAQAVSPPRFITYHQPFSMFGDAFWPPEPGKSQYDKRSGTIDLYPRSGVGPLDNPNFEFTETLKPLESVRSEMLILEGLQNAGSNHDGYCSILNGYEPLEISDTEVTGGGISLDHYLAKQLGHDKTMRFPNLQLGVIVTAAGTKSAVSWIDKGQSVPAMENPRNVFNKLFPSSQVVAPAATAPTFSADMLRARQKSVLDAAIQHAETLRPSLSTLDRQKLDQYLEAFRSVEQRIDIVSQPTVSCMTPAYPADLFPTNGEINEQYLALQPQIADVMMDLGAMAFACDLTRIITFQMNEEGNNLVFTWIPGQRARWHDLSHIWLTPGQVPYEMDPNDPGSMSWWEDVQNFINVGAWNAGQVFKLQEKLKQHAVYDNTLLLWTTNMGQGNSHASINIPLVLLGNLNKYFKTGRHIRIIDSNSLTTDPIPEFDPTNMRYINDLLTTILNAYGLPDANFGDPMISRGAISEIRA
ncbi:MAG: DUF1552 domain-containing protein [Polyangiaceae bacterium]|nr:DUF1552 domain-containing protein [Polyangiaceae bacterium]